MHDLSQANQVSGSSSKLALSLLLVGALFCTGAKWAEKPIGTLADVVGEWSGEGTTAKGYNYPLELVFFENGVYRYSWQGSSGSESGERPPGTVHVNGGKLEFIDSRGFPWTATVYEHKKKGQRMMKGLRHSDGSTFNLKQR